MGIPRYITVTSTSSSPLSSPWFSVDWYANPINIGLAVISNSSAWNVDVTMDDPFGNYPSSAGPTVFTSTATSGGGIAAGSTVSAIGAITTPIAALRLTVSSSGTSTLTVLSVRYLADDHYLQCCDH